MRVPSVVLSVCFAVSLVGLAGCGEFGLRLFGDTVVSESDWEIRLTNNLVLDGQPTVVKEPRASNGGFFRQNRGGKWVGPEVWTSETIGGEIGYVGDRGLTVSVSAKVFSADGKFIGLIRDDFYVYRHYDSYEPISIDWVVDTSNFYPVESLSSSRASNWN